MPKIKMQSGTTTFQVVKVKGGKIVASVMRGNKKACEKRADHLNKTEGSVSAKIDFAVCLDSAHA